MKWVAGPATLPNIAVNGVGSSAALHLANTGRVENCQRKNGIIMMAKTVRIGFAALTCLIGTSAAQATTEIATTARGVFSNVRVVGSPATLVGPIASVSGRTSPGYNLTGSAASLAASVGLGTVSGITATLDLISGAIATAASADGTTPADTTTSNASAAVNNLAISLLTGNGGSTTSVLSLTANQVQSQTNANKLVGLSSQSVFTNLNLMILGGSILTLGSNVQVAPNFVAYDQGGLKVTFNQQFASNFANTRVLITNAVGINFSNYLLDGRRLNGGVVVGQSVVEYNSTAPIPEPATWAQLLAGFGLAGAAARRRRILAGA